MTTPVVCRDPECRAILSDFMVRLGASYCGQKCADRHTDAIIADSMAAQSVAQRDRPQSARPFCAWCGDNLSPKSRKRFCSAACGRDFAADEARQA